MNYVKHLLQPMLPSSTTLQYKGHEIVVKMERKKVVEYDEASMISKAVDEVDIRREIHIDGKQVVFNSNMPPPKDDSIEAFFEAIDRVLEA